MKVKTIPVKTNKGKIAKMVIDRSNLADVIHYHIMVADYLGHFPLSNRYVMHKFRDNPTYYIYHSDNMETPFSATDKLRKAQRIIASKAIDGDMRYPVNPKVQSYSRGIGTAMDTSPTTDKESIPVNVKPNAHLFNDAIQAASHCKVGYGPSLNYDRKVGYLGRDSKSK